ncbi:hypothetical protein PENDEC_c028G01873 [Penicillium decumbens]|uniref:Uncharacterized protein n=1 Tax=Penicillium decumbens TaxID=69771 RepID=A0A1V6NZ95_PENDC|nr:hypothetical protein PENDEC_c028G01873 [Penicillium decumbens]
MPVWSRERPKVNSAIAVPAAAFAQRNSDPHLTSQIIRLEPPLALAKSKYCGPLRRNRASPHRVPRAGNRGTESRPLDQAAQNNANVNGITASSFEDAWIAYSKDFFEQMQENLQDFVTARINEVTKYWSSSAATKAFTKAGAAAVAKALAEKLSGVSTDVVIDSTFVQ